MNDDMTFKALMDSEVFRAFAASEMNKLQKQAEDNEKELAHLLEQVDVWQDKIQSSPKMAKAFKTLQNKFANDSEFTAKHDTKFVEAVMMLNLHDSEQS